MIGTALFVGCLVMAAFLVIAALLKLTEPRVTGWETIRALFWLCASAVWVHLAFVVVNR